MQDLEKAKQLLRRRLFKLRLLKGAVLAGSFMLVVTSAHADGSGSTAGFQPLANFLNAIVTFCQSTFGRSMAILAVMFVGAQFMLGNMRLFLVLSIILGIAVFFGAPQMVTGWISAITG